MQLAVLSDIHGNLPALQAVMRDMEEFDVDHVIVAGDNINWAPFSVQVMEVIAHQRWAVIRGNHETYFLEWGTSRAPAYRSDWTMPRWLNEIMPDDLGYKIASLPDTLTLFYPGVPPIRLVHGSPGDHFRGIYEQTTDEEIAEMLGAVSEETVIAGHTHLTLDRRSGRWHILNPGSVGVPLDGIQGASYMLIESAGGPWEPTFRNVEYDLMPLFDEFERVGFLEAHSPLSYLIMEEFKVARPIVWGFRQWCKAHHADEPETVALAEDYLHDPQARWDHLHPFYHLNLPGYLNGGKDGHNGR